MFESGDANYTRITTKKVDITVSQGSALSPFLFVLAFDCIENHIEEDPLRAILYITLIADSREELEEKVQLWKGALADNGLRLNDRKTKLISCEQCTESILGCLGEVIEKEEEFRYLGSELSEEGNMVLQDTQRQAIYYRTVVRPDLLYGCPRHNFGNAETFAYIDVMMERRYQILQMP
ncbi:unnamed protein product [Heligmosomoides polygyrus]|uniref:Reverse transcriptase domain-containing protein n=1 Tax=Heligmosomoides polygyrus TaxID=6339 RepID=A0A183GDN6_HELPZ|nr:unnamed protein product [Heligmosomoides polygyrus]